MRTNTTFLTVLLVTAGVCCFGQQPSSNPQPTALTLVISTGWASEHYMADYRTLARQAVMSLHPGDYLEIVTARTDHPRLELAQTIKTGNAEEIKSIEAVLARIQSQFLSSPSMAAALEVAFERLKQTCLKRGIISVTAVVLTDGQMNSEEAQRILVVADKFKERGWQLCCTGTPSTAPDILVGANKGRLTWVLTGEANPSLWLMRKTAEPPAAKVKDERVPEPPAPAQPTTPSPATAQPQASQEKPLEHIIGPGPVPAPQGAGYRVTTQIDSVVTLPPGAHVPANKITESTGEPVIEANEPAKPAASPAVSAAPAAATKPSSWARFIEWWGQYWRVLLVLTLLVGSMFAVMTMGTSGARQWDAKIRNYIKTPTLEDMGTLVARWGTGQSCHLGPLSRFHQAHIGPGSKNTIQTPGTTAGDRHVTLFRKGEDLMIKNHATAPITVGGVEVAPRHKRRVTLPSDIQLDEKTHVSLGLVGSKIGSSQKGRSGDEQATESQHVG